MAWGVAGRGRGWVRGWMGKHLLGVSLAIMVAGLVGGAVVTAVDPSWVSAGESGSTTIRNLGFVIAGLVALPLAVWRARVADRQAEATQRQAETAHDDLRNRRYQESAAMLGSDVLAVRMAGIYALERLAEDHPEKYHIEIMKLLWRVRASPDQGQASRSDVERGRWERFGVVRRAAKSQAA